MAAHITEIVKTGTLKALNGLRKEIPATVSELMAIEGLGPKRTKQLHEQLGVNSIKDLQTSTRRR